MRLKDQSCQNRCLIRPECLALSMNIPGSSGDRSPSLPFVGRSFRQPQTTVSTLSRLVLLFGLGCRCLVDRCLVARYLVGRGLVRRCLVDRTKSTLDDDQIFEHGTSLTCSRTQCRYSQSIHRLIESSSVVAIVVIQQRPGVLLLRGERRICRQVHRDLGLDAMSSGYG